MKLYKRISYILTFGIMAIGLVTFSITPGTKGIASSSSSKGSASDFDVENAGSDLSTPSSLAAPAKPSPSPTPSPTPEPEPNNLECDAYPEINKLIEAYLQAKLECNLEAFDEILTDSTYIDIEDIQLRTQTITDFDSVTCYTKRGFGDIDYKVYYTYMMHIIDIDTPIIGIDSLLVQYQADGSPKIFFGYIPDDVEQQLNKLDEDDDVRSLIDETYEEMDLEISQDESLLAFLMRMYDE